MVMKLSTDINWKYTNDLEEASEWLSSLPDTIACDFETASRWTIEEKAKFKELLPYSTKWNRIKLQQKISSDGLSHPALSIPTHLSVAWSDHDSFVIILDTDEIRSAVLHWLADTDRKQIWHNLGFDGKHIAYNTGKFPQNYEDTQILAKTLLNNVDNFKSQTGLKTLMAYKYGDWAIAGDMDFTIENIYDDRMLYYAAIDSCATYSLWEQIQDDIKA